MRPPFAAIFFLFLLFLDIGVKAKVDEQWLTSNATMVMQPRRLTNAVPWELLVNTNNFCEIVEDGCIQTVGFPNSYNPNGYCRFHATSGGYIKDVIGFQLEINVDFLVLNTKAYTGQDDFTLYRQETVHGGIESWSDGANEEGTGWKICPRASCSTFICPALYGARLANQDIPCAGTTCTTEADLDRCCLPKCTFPADMSGYVVANPSGCDLAISYTETESENCQFRCEGDQYYASGAVYEPACPGPGGTFILPPCTPTSSSYPPWGIVGTCERYSADCVQTTLFPIPLYDPNGGVCLLTLTGYYLINITYLQTEARFDELSARRVADDGSFENFVVSGVLGSPTAADARPFMLPPGEDTGIFFSYDSQNNGIGNIFRICAQPMCGTYVCPAGRVFDCDKITELCAGLSCTDAEDDQRCCRDPTAEESSADPPIINGSTAFSMGCGATTTTTSTTTTTAQPDTGQLVGWVRLGVPQELQSNATQQGVITEAWGRVVTSILASQGKTMWLFPGVSMTMEANDTNDTALSWKIGYQVLGAGGPEPSPRPMSNLTAMLAEELLGSSTPPGFTPSVEQHVTSTGFLTPYSLFDVPHCEDFPGYEEFQIFCAPSATYYGWEDFANRVGGDTGLFMITDNVLLEQALFAAEGLFPNQPRATEACCQCGGGTCQPGSFILRGETAATLPRFCAPCQMGRFTDTTDALECALCPPGRQGVLTGALDCLECREGSYSDANGTTACFACELGSYQDETAQTSCKLCPPGFESTGARRTCEVCPAGRFSDDYGVTECSKCPAGRYKPEGDVNCSLCEPGRFSQIDGQSICIECAAGEQANGEGQTLCDYCGAGRFAENTGMQFCDPCAPGHFQDEARSSACYECEEGQFAGDEGLTACILCPNGTKLDYRAGTACSECVPGQFNDLLGQLECRPCATGTFSDTPGFDLCKGCPAGQYNPSAGFAECYECSPGTYAEELGATRCVECESGRFIGAWASTSCTACKDIFANLSRSPDYWTTLKPDVYDESIQAVRWIVMTAATNVSSCGCEAGSQPDGQWDLDYVNGGPPADPLNGRGSGCASCGEGLQCLGMGQLRIEVNYAWDGKLGVYDCNEGIPNACTGGVPGVCAIGRDETSTACAECLPGRVGSADGPCYECNGADYAVPATLLAFALVVFCIGYCIYDRSKAKRPSLTSLLILISVGQFVTIVQQLGVVSSIRVDWQNPLADLFQFVSQLSFLDVDMLRPSCIVNMDPVRQYLGRVLTVYLALAFMGVAHAVSQVVQHRHDWKTRTPMLLCALGTVVMAFFVSIISTMLGPMQCKEHPNSKRTVSWFPSVLCWESQRHTDMLIVGIVACTLPLAFLAAAVWAAKVFPKKLMRGSRVFLTSWAFLFFRYHTNAYWYGPILLTRNALMAVGPTLPTPVLQIIFLEIVMLLSLQVVMRLMPWRAYFANFLESVTHTAILVVVMVSSFFVDDRPTRTLSAVGFGFIALMPLGILVLILIAIVKLFRSATKPYQFFLCHHKAGAGCFARLLKMRLLKTKGVNRKVFIDTDDLQNLDTLFDMVAQDTEVLVAIHSAQLLMRPWCAGEIVTAHRNKLHVSVIRMQGVDKPGADFIENFLEHVPDVTCLTEQGINYEMVKEALEYFNTLHSIHLAEEITDEDVSELATNLVAKMGHASSKNVKVAGRKCHPEACVILADRKDLEAASTAFILKEFLTVIVTTEHQVPVHVLASDQTVPGTVHKLVLVCTNGVFHCPVADALVTASRNHETIVMPIMSTNNFIFPTATILATVPASQDLDDDEFDHFVTYVQSIFTEIAVDFKPSALSATEDSLVARAGDVGRRLWSGMATVKSRMGSAKSKSVMTVTDISPTGSSPNRGMRNSRRHSTARSKLSAVDVAIKKAGSMDNPEAVGPGSDLGSIPDVDNGDDGGEVWDMDEPGDSERSKVMSPAIPPSPGDDRPSKGAAWDMDTGEKLYRAIGSFDLEC